MSILKTIVSLDIPVLKKNKNNNEIARFSISNNGGNPSHY